MTSSGRPNWGFWRAASLVRVMPRLTRRTPQEQLKDMGAAVPLEDGGGDEDAGGFQPAEGERADDR